MFVPSAPVGPPLLLHARLEHVAAAILIPVLQGAESAPHSVVVQVVELVDDLERPAPIEDIAPHHVALERRCLLGLAGRRQHLCRLTEEQVRPPDQLMEAVEVPSGSLDVLERLGRLAHRLDDAGRLVGRNVLQERLWLHHD